MSVPYRVCETLRLCDAGYRGDTTLLFGTLRKGDRFRHVGITAAAGGISVACCGSGDPLPRLLAAEYLAGEPDDAAGAPLLDVVKRLGLSGAPCQWVMTPEQYQLVQIDSPDVPENERLDAARWRLRDLIRIPMDEAVIDGFAVPDDRGRGNSGKLYMAASRRSDADALAKLARHAGLRPKALGIPELALRNLAALHPDQRGGIAMLGVSGEDIILTIGRGDTLFLCRWLDWGLDGRDAAGMEKTALEVQRSLDFYESQLTGSPASRVVVVPRSIENTAELAAGLGEQLAIPVEALDLSALMDVRTTLPAEVEMHCALAVGAALEPMP